MNTAQLIFLIEQASKTNDKLSTEMVYARMNPEISGKDRDKILKKYYADISRIDYIIIALYKQIHETYKKNQALPGEADRLTVRKFLKDFKHEFLTQMTYSPAPIDSLIASTLEYVPNPGVNIGNYIIYLHKKGYFTSVCDYEPEKTEFAVKSAASLLKRVASEVVVAVPTEKALRYLENEANISLKENQKTI